MTLYIDLVIDLSYKLKGSVLHKQTKTHFFN